MVLAWRVINLLTFQPSQVALQPNQELLPAVPIVEVKSGVIPVPAKASSSDKLTDYLRQLEVAEDEVW